MTAQRNKMRLTIFLACLVIFAGALAVSAAFQEQAGTPSGADATSASLEPQSQDATPDLFVPTSQDATPDLFVPTSQDATSASAPLPEVASLPSSAPSTSDVITVSVADVEAAGFKDVKIQPPLGVGLRFDVPHVTYFRVNQTNLSPKSRWVTEGAADIVSVFISPDRGCPPGIAGDPKLIEYEGRIQVRFCHSVTAPIYIVVTGPDQTKAIELADIIDRK